MRLIPPAISALCPRGLTAAGGLPVLVVARGVIENEAASPFDAHHNINFWGTNLRCLLFVEKKLRATETIINNPATSAARDSHIQGSIANPSSVPGACATQLKAVLVIFLATPTAHAG